MRASSATLELVASFTFVAWGGCVIVAISGLVGPPAPRGNETPPPVVVDPVEVSLVNVPAESAMLSPTLDDTSPATVDPTPSPDEPPPAAAIAPSPAVAFAIPIDVPTRVASAARPAPPVRPVRAAAPMQSRSTVGSKQGRRPAAVQQLTFGLGEGRQPAPEYPADAALAGQQGRVGVLFSVDTSGRVIQASVEHSSAWPILNQAAVEAVRNSWRFSPGATRTYRVTIQFQLAQ